MKLNFFKLKFQKLSTVLRQTRKEFFMKYTNRLLTLALTGALTLILVAPAQAMNSASDLTLATACHKWEVASQIYQNSGININNGLNEKLFECSPDFSTYFYVLNGASLNTTSKTGSTLYTAACSNLHIQLKQILERFASSKRANLDEVYIHGRATCILVLIFFLYASCDNGLPLQTQEEFEDNFSKLKNKMAKFELNSPKRVKTHCSQGYNDRANACITQLENVCNALQGLLATKRILPSGDIFELMADIMIMIAPFNACVFPKSEEIQKTFYKEYISRFHVLCDDWEKIKALRV
jgi:hypothetical protein